MSFSTEDLKAAYLLGRSNKNEVTPEMLQKKGWSNEKIMQVINSLNEKRLGVLRRNKVTNRLSLIVRDDETAAAVRQLTPEDYSVYCCIEEAGNIGIWTSDMAKATGFQNHVVQRAVKTLCEVRKLIKPLKSIHQSKRKIYILVGLEPSKEVVGGSFYDNGEFDEDLVNRLRDQIIHVLKNGSRASFSEVTSYIRSSGCAQNLSDDDLRLVLRTLEFEQQVQSTVNPATGEAVYLWSKWPADDAFSTIPCSSCPVANECIRSKGSRVNPATCRYFDYWLSYDDGIDGNYEDDS